MKKKVALYNAKKLRSVIHKELNKLEYEYEKGETNLEDALTKVEQAVAFLEDLHLGIDELRGWLFQLEDCLDKKGDYAEDFPKEKK